MSTQGNGRHESRYEAVSRRAFLRQVAALGAVAVVPGLAAACARDQEVFSSAAEATRLPTAMPIAATRTPAPTATATATAASAAASPFQEGGEMVVRFTYSADGASPGAVRNPYVAVWVEDSDGELVATIALWFLQTRKGTRWLSDLRRWYSVDGSSATVNTLSSATRTPGDYSVVWDGVAHDGASVPSGDYYVCIEAAREHGPYSLIREAVTLTEGAFAVPLPDDGELRNASVEMIVV
jgi:hypothetical protein